MPFFSSFTGSFTGGRRRPRGLGLGVGGGGGSTPTDFSAALAATPAATSGFGMSAIMSGDGSTMVMGDYADASLANFSGAAYVYTSRNGSWEYVEKLTPPSQPTPTPNGGYYLARFGNNLAITQDGSRLFVAAPFHGTSGSGANYSGTIYVYDRQPDNTFTLFQRIDRPRSSNADMSDGWFQVSSDGSYIAVPLFWDVNADGIYQSMDVYEISGGVYTKLNTVSQNSKQVSVFFYKNTGANRETRADISDDGLWAIYSVPDDGTGKVYTASYDGTNWNSNSLISSTGASNDFGQSISLSSDGSVAAISNTGQIGFQRVSVQRRSGSTWTEEQLINFHDPNGNGYPRYFGSVVKLLPDGETLFIYAPQGTTGGTAAVYVYTHSGGVWTLAETVDTGWTDTRAYLAVAGTGLSQGAMSVTDDGTTIVLSDNVNDTAEFFQTTGGPYYSVGGGGGGGGAADFSVATDFTAAFTSLADTSNTGNLGTKVSMSADKSTMIMHRHTDNDVATSAGAIEIFKNNNDGTWSYVEKFVIPSQTPGANGGYSQSGFGDGVALSADGSKIAVSGTGHGVNGANQNCGGAIWVLERQGDGTYAEFDRIDRPYSSNPNLGRAIDISADGNYIAATGSQLTHVSNIIYKLNSGTGEYEKMNTTTDGASNGVSVNWGSGSNLARGGHQNMVAAISDDGLYTVIGNQGSYEFGIGYGYAAVGFYDGSNWGVQQELRPANTSNPFGGKYGVSVDINEDGTVCVVGSTRHYNVGNSSRVGAFYVWRRTGTSWTEEQRVLGTSTNGFLGNNVRILPDGNTIFATAIQENGASNKKILVYTYDSGSGSWSLAETIETNYTDANFENEDQMDVSRDGSLVVVTAYGNTGNKALFFETTGGPYYSVGGGGGGGADFSSTTLAYTLDNPNAYGTSADDRFGYSVAMSSNYAIVGSPYEDDAGGTTSGKAYIFDVSDGSLAYTLDNPNAYDTSADDRFGLSVAISSNYAIVGAYFEDDAGGISSGKAYIYDLSDGSLAYTLDNPNAYDTSANDWFGISVAISDTHAIVGAYQEDDAGGISSGKAYIFDLSDGSLTYTLDNPNPYDTSLGDFFGRSVSISDTHAIVGADTENDAGGIESGKAYIYDLSDGSLVSTLDNPNAYGTSAEDQFGRSVAISGNYAIVGAYREDDAGGSASGKAYIFQGSA